MSLFDFLKKKESNILEPKLCQSEIPIEITEIIAKVNWIDFQTAYGNAEKTIPYYLKNLFCADEQIAMHATHQLWCSLCHQHAFISNAALPAYDILKSGLIQLNNDLKIELLDILVGFASCLSKGHYTVPNELFDWEKQLQAKMLLDRDIFTQLALDENADIVNFSKKICEHLDDTKQ